MLQCKLNHSNSKYQHRRVSRVVKDHRRSHQRNQFYHHPARIWPTLRAQQLRQPLAFTVSTNHTRSQRLPRDPFHRQLCPNIRHRSVKWTVIAMSLAQDRKSIGPNVIRCAFKKKKYQSNQI